MRHRRRVDGRFGAALLALLVALVVAVPVQEGVRAQAGPASLRLAAQTPWARVGAPFELQLDVERAPTGSTLAVRVHERVAGRIRFEQTFEGDDLGTALPDAPAPIPLNPAAVDADGTTTIGFTVSAGPAQPVDVELPTVVPPSLVVPADPAEGVYPLVVRLTAPNGDVLDELVTYLVVLPPPERAGPALSVALVAPLDAGDGFDEHGEVVLGTTDLAGLQASIDLLASPEDLPVTLQVGPRTIDAVGTAAAQGSAEAEEVSSGLTSVATGRAVLGATYAPTEVGAWLSASETDPVAADLLDEQLRVGSALLSGLGAPTSVAWPLDRTYDAAGLGWVSAAGYDRVLVPEDQVAPFRDSAREGSATRPFELAPEGSTEGSAGPEAVLLDATLESRLTSSDDPALSAQRLVANLAVLYFDEPSVARGVALRLPSLVDVDEGARDAREQVWAAVLDALWRPRGDEGQPGAPGAPVVSAAEVGALFELSEPVGALSYSSDAPEPLGALVQQTAAATERASSIRSMGSLGAADRSERQAMAAASQGYGAERRTAQLAGAESIIQSQLASIVAPSQEQVTLTEDAGRLPLTLENRLPHPVQVELTWTSAKLEFPEGAVQEVTLAAASPTRVEVAVEALASGAFPLEVEVTTPDGGLQVANTRFTVRSTAISGIGLVLSVAAGAFLLVWWLRHFRTVRRDRRLVSVNHPSRGHVAPSVPARPGGT